MLWQSRPLLDNTPVKLFVWNIISDRPHLISSVTRLRLAISNLSSKIAKNNLIHLWAVSPTEIYLSNWNQNKSNAVILPTLRQPAPSAHIIILCFNYKIFLPAPALFVLQKTEEDYFYILIVVPAPSQSIPYNFYYADLSSVRKCPGERKLQSGGKNRYKCQNIPTLWSAPSLAPLKIYNWF